MASCKDCIHEEICDMPIITDGRKNASNCKKFKNKADYAEVKHGQWLPVQYTYFGLKRYECSECKDDEYWRKRYIEHKEKYCPNCGAKMDGKEMKL